MQRSCEVQHKQFGVCRIFALTTEQSPTDALKTVGG